jgi:hypothetical protein
MVPVTNLGIGAGARSGSRSPASIRRTPAVEHRSTFVQRCPPRRCAERECRELGRQRRSCRLCGPGPREVNYTSPAVSFLRHPPAPRLLPPGAASRPSAYRGEATGATCVHLVIACGSRVGRSKRSLGAREIAGVQRRRNRHNAITGAHCHNRAKWPSRAILRTCVQRATWTQAANLTTEDELWIGIPR